MMTDITPEGYITLREYTEKYGVGVERVKALIGGPLSAVRMRRSIMVKDEAPPEAPYIGNEKYISTKEYAEKYFMSEGVVRREVRQGRLEGHKVAGDHLRVKDEPPPLEALAKRLRAEGYVSVKEVTRMTGKTEDRIWYCVHAENIPIKRVGKAMYIPGKIIEEIRRDNALLKETLTAKEYRKKYGYSKGRIVNMCRLGSEKVCPVEFTHPSLAGKGYRLLDKPPTTGKWKREK